MHRMRRHCLTVGFLVGIAFGSPSSDAQYTDNFQTNTISGVTSNWSGDYLVGSNTFADALLIQSGGVLTNANGYLGYEVSSSNNSALVTDAGSVWSKRSNLYVGFSGANNSLVISNGGRVVSLSREQLQSGDYVGYKSSSSNNTILVTDLGSVWSNSEAALYLGYIGAGNSLVVRNGGQVPCSSSYIGYGPKTNSNVTLNGSNSVLVTDTGSVWTNRVSLYLGYGMGGNSFVLSNGARTFDATGYLGYNSSSNSAWVSGSDSIWSNSASLYVGYSGGQNSLFIDHGGQVVCAQSAYAGYNAQSTGNSVTISGPGSSWTCPFLISVGWSGSGNSLVISNGGMVSAAGGCAIGGSGGGSNNSVLVTDVSSVFSNNNLILGGSSGDGNSLVVSNGGRMVCGGYTYLGEYGGGSSVRVTGPGSAWTSGGEVYMGFFTTSNTLTVTEGASVRSSSAWLGINGGANSNVALVSGPGSVWSNDTLLTIGWTTANSVIVSNGGALVSTSIQAGYSGSSNSLIITGGSVVTTNLIIGAASSSCDHWVELDAGSLTVTNATHDATLEVRDGQLVINAGNFEVDVLVMNTPCGTYIRNGGTVKVHRLVTNQTQDSVGDGIPDLWRKVYFGGDGTTTNSQNCATCDPDGDGFSNLQEYLIGTDSTDSSSAFRITNIAREGDDIRVTWMTPAGWTNALQAGTGDASGGYSKNGFQDIFILTNTVSGLTNYLDVGAATNVPSRFYRVWLKPSWAAVHFVDLNSTNPVPPYATPATAATNIQDAVAVSDPADLVLVTNGVYATGMTVANGILTNRVAVTKPVTVQSVNGPAVTVIDGGGTMRCLYLTNGVWLSGFTLTNGAADVGAGVWCESSSSVISNCVLVGNIAETGNGFGGAAYQGTLNSCVLNSNSAWWGGGVYSSAVDNCTLYNNWGNLGGGAYGSTLSGCILSNNATPNGGGGAYSCTLNNCLLATNSANWAGGAWDCTLSNCTLTGNGANQDGGGVESCILNNCTLSYNFVGSDNQTSCCCGWTAGGGAAFSTLNNCTLLRNSAHVYIIYETDGGGAYQSTLNNCLVIGNFTTGAGAGGGGGVFGGTANNCTIVGNRAGYYAGGGGIQGTVVNNSIVVNNDHQGVANNYAGGSFAFSCSSPLPYGRGNIGNDPRFVNSGGGDYHLQANSPCINAGNNDYVAGNDVDLDGNLRIVGGTVDIGAYEFQTPTSIISYAWLQQYGLPIDGSADFIDSDGNGVSNWQKWITGIDPTNSQSLFRIIDITQTGNDVLVTWELGWGAVNALQISSGDTSGAYAADGFGDIAIFTNYGNAETVTNYLDVGAATNGPSRYYRVRLVP